MFAVKAIRGRKAEPQISDSPEARGGAKNKSGKNRGTDTDEANAESERCREVGRAEGVHDP